MAEDLRREFGLTDKQKLIVESTCVLKCTKPSLEAHGRLILFSDYICFMTEPKT